MTYRAVNKNLGAVCKAMQACQTYFCGAKFPIAADMEGAKLSTSQSVLVVFCKKTKNENFKEL